MLRLPLAFLQLFLPSEQSAGKPLLILGGFLPVVVQMKIESFLRTDHVSFVRTLLRIIPFDRNTYGEHVVCFQIIRPFSNRWAGLIELLLT